MKANINRSNISKNLREVRKKKGYTQDQLAKLSGVCKKTIVHYENYAVKFSIDRIKKLANALDVPDEKLTGISEFFA